MKVEKEFSILKQIEKEGQEKIEGLENPIALLKQEKKEEGKEEGEKLNIKIKKLEANQLLFFHQLSNKKIYYYDYSNNKKVAQIISRK